MWKRASVFFGQAAKTCHKSHHRCWKKVLSNTESESRREGNKALFSLSPLHCTRKARGEKGLLQRKEKRKRKKNFSALLKWLLFFFFIRFLCAEQTQCKDYISPDLPFLLVCCFSVVLFLLSSHELLLETKTLRNSRLMCGGYYFKMAIF